VSRPGHSRLSLLARWLAPALALAAVGVVSCLGSPLARRCDSDLECPDYSFCDLMNNRCVAYGKELGHCGDGVIDYNIGEQCDEGDREGGDGCSPRCRLEIPWSCGDGAVDFDQAEQCDDAMQCDDGRSCLRNSHCQGVGSELCRQRDGDGCSATCQIEAPASCGDNILDQARGEQCDDGSACEDGAACTGPDQCAAIGRGSCAPRGGDGCSAACRAELPASCGDGEIQSDERCDEGEEGNGDLCYYDSSGGAGCRCSPPCGCNQTCDLTATTELVAGSPGENALVDGAGLGEARLGGSGGGLVIAAGILFFTDLSYDVIRAIDLETGVVTTVAGDSVSGGQGYEDNPTNGLGARFDMSTGGLATDGMTLWITDGDNHVLRAMAVTPPYGVTTVAGRQYDSSSDCVHVDPDGPDCYFDSADPVNVEFVSLTDLLYLDGYVYILDYSMDTLRRFDPRTGAVDTVAGAPDQSEHRDGVGTAARFYYPRSLATDGSGLLYIGESSYIRTYNTATGEVSTLLAGSGYLDGALDEAQLRSPYGLVSDGVSLYWSEYSNNTIRQMRIATGTVTTLVGWPTASNCYDYTAYAEGTGNEARFGCPSSLAFDFASRSIYLVDIYNSVIRRVR